MFNDSAFFERTLRGRFREKEHFDCNSVYPNIDCILIQLLDYHISSKVYCNTKSMYTKYLLCIIKQRRGQVWLQIVGIHDIYIYINIHRMVRFLRSDLELKFLFHREKCSKHTL